MVLTWIRQPDIWNVAGGSSSRSLNLENKYNKEIKVNIYSEGDIKKLINSYISQLAAEKTKETKLNAIFK